MNLFRMWHSLLPLATAVTIRHRWFRRAEMRNALTPYSTLLLFAASFIAPSAFADFMRIEQDHPSVTYTGNWSTGYGSRLSGGSAAAAGGDAGDRATVTFTGTGIVWIGYKSEWTEGYARVYLDGVFAGEVQPIPGEIETRAKYPRFAVSGLPHGMHTLAIEATGQHDYWSNVIIDAFHIETGVVTQVLEESSPAITYTGSWTRFDDPSVSGGSVLAARDAGASATVNFRGHNIAWIGYRCPCASGIARFYFPNGANWLVYQQAAVHQAQVVMEGSNATPGIDQQVKIEVTGEATGGGAPWVVLDAFRVLSSTDGPDTRPPEIALRAPAEGAVLHGEVLLVEDTFDNASGIASMRFYVDGVEGYVRMAQRPPDLIQINYWWDTTRVSDGPHVLTLVARDAAGNETRSAPINVVVDNARDWTPPEVTLTAPVQNARVTGLVTLSANATDNVGVALVRFYATPADAPFGSDAHAIFLGEAPSAPFSITRDTSTVMSGKQFLLQARAFDAMGNERRSQFVQVTVQH
jgi:hypothetical protein